MITVNIQLSKELKKKYRHRIKHCYSNSLRLLDEKEVAYIEIGYVASKENGEYIRHCWGIREGQIIDTSLNEWKIEKIEKLEYHPVFKINSRVEMMFNTSGPAALELDPEKEYLFLEKKLGSIERVINCAVANGNNVLIDYIQNK